MATDKASPKDPQAYQDPSSETSEQGTVHTGSGEAGGVSDDINRIASYLTEKRSAASDRTQGLAAEIAQRRSDIVAKADHSEVFATRLSELANDLPDSRPDRRHVARPHPTPFQTNPILAKRFHVFCRELDQLMDGFRARIEYNKQVRH
jgi:hypothetical protein